ncbi:hypothetical protein XELAEV_18033518mg [Xenopus laevis]|uniref:CARMIL pleckstrin homology domain-containing protein n=1 Tax=Xenopus laevis TaxID=8355 RepID=A0A974CKW8_XENLA|nr:hypothetical protein XELAEV_18033518mg [Xenopus laevis]
MTEETSEVPRELLESIRDIIGRKIKIAVRKKVKLELKGDRVENKVLVLTSCRAFILTARVPTKVKICIILCCFCFTAPSFISRDALNLTFPAKH